MKPSKDKIEKLSSRVYKDSSGGTVQLLFSDTDPNARILQNIEDKLNEVIEKLNLHEEYFDKDIHIMVEGFNERLDKLESQPEEQFHNSLCKLMENDMKDRMKRDMQEVPVFTGLAKSQPEECSHLQDAVIKRFKFLLTPETRRSFEAWQKNNASQPEEHKHNFYSDCYVMHGKDEIRDPSPKKEQCEHQFTRIQRYYTGCKKCLISKPENTKVIYTSEGDAVGEE